MDFTLRCNYLKCRSPLNDCAVVTTCSHIFCINCSDSLGLSNANGGIRSCPACESQLANPDDVVVAHLNPTEDYKTSVLSGLSPGIIMECAGRGLAFYSYQCTQEIVYQEYLAKSLTDKYTSLSAQMDKIIHDANSEITGLRDKLAAVQVDQKNLEQRHNDLTDAFREKTKAFQQIDKAYRSLKAQVMSAQVATAASDDAEIALQSVTGNRFVDRLGTRSSGQADGHRYPVDQRGIEQIHSRQRSGGSGEGRRRADVPHNVGPMAGTNSWNQPAQASRGFTSQSASVEATPSQHRTRLPVSMQNGRTSGILGADGMAGVQRTPSTRQPLNDLSANTFGFLGTGGYGMSAGLKMGKHSEGLLARPAPRGTRPPGAPNMVMR